MGAWQKLDSEYVHENAFYKVRKDRVIRPDGNEGTYHVVESGRAAYIIAITDDNKILFVHMFRYPTQMESWELPAGGVEDGEESLDTAKRELQEETGLAADTWELLGTLQDSNSKMDGLDDIYLCRGLRETGSHHQEEEGITKRSAFTVDELFAMIAHHEITDNTSITALMLALTQNKLPNPSFPTRSGIQ